MAWFLICGAAVAAVAFVALWLLPALADAWRARCKGVIGDVE